MLIKYQKPVKFAIVGGIGAIISLSLMYIGVDLIGINYLVNYAMTFTLVVSLNYLLNKTWTFADYKSRGIFRFYLGRIGTLIINEGILYLLVSIIGIQYIFGTMVAIMVSVMLNYKYSRRKVWKELKVT